MSTKSTRTTERRKWSFLTQTKAKDKMNINKLVNHLREDIREQQTGIKRDRQAIKTLKSMTP